MKKTILIAIALGAIVAAPTIGYSRGYYGGGHYRGGHSHHNGDALLFGLGALAIFGTAVALSSPPVYAAPPPPPAYGYGYSQSYYGTPRVCREDRPIFDSYGYVIGYRPVYRDC